MCGWGRWDSWFEKGGRVCRSSSVGYIFGRESYQYDDMWYHYQFNRPTHPIRLRASSSVNVIKQVSSIMDIFPPPCTITSRASRKRLAQTTLPLRSTSSTISGAKVPLSVRPISAAKVLCGTHLAEVLGDVSSIMRSTCSSERPLVSGIKKYE